MLLKVYYVINILKQLFIFINGHLSNTQHFSSILVI